MQFKRSSLAAFVSIVFASASVTAGVAPLPFLVEPPSGSLSGGIEVKIGGGLGFSAGVLGVFFGEAPSPLVTVIDDRTLVAVLPPGRVPAPAVDVIVATEKDRFVLPRGFRYVNDPPAARASPDGKGYMARLGRTLALDGSASREPNGAAGDRIALFEWDLDGNKIPDRRGEIVVLTPSEVAALLTPSKSPGQDPAEQPVTRTVTLTVTDLHGDRGLDTTSLTLVDEPEVFPSDDYRDWVGDADGNRIDDAIDAKADPEEVDAVVLLAHGSDLDAAAARFAPYSSAPPIKVPAITALSLHGITAGDIRAVVAVDPELFRAEEEILLEATVSVSGAAIRARPSLEHSPDTAHDRGVLGAGVNIAFLDSGIDDDHPALAGKFVGGVNVLVDDATAIGSQSNPDDDFEFAGFFHGTHMAGIALSADTVHEGVAPAAKLLDVKVLDHLGRGTTQDLLLGLQWCMNHRTFAWPGEPPEHHGIDVVNLSVSSKVRSDGKDSLSMMVDAAVAAGLVVVASAGNSGTLGSGFGAPGAADRAITISAIDDRRTVDTSDDTAIPASNFGPRLDDGDADPIEELKPDVVAPGNSIVTTSGNVAGQPASDFTNASGSSAAAAHAAGVAALIIEAEGSPAPATVKSLLRNTAEPGGSPSFSALDPTYSVQFGKGIIDAFHALPSDLGNANAVWISASEDDEAWAAQPDLTAPYASAFQTGSPYPIGGGLEPHGIAVDARGNVWLANRSSASVTKLSAAGQVRFHVGLGPPYGAIAGTDVAGIAIDGAGDAWLTLTSAGRVARIRAGGSADPVTYPAGGAPVAVATDASGAVWIANSSSGDVTKLDASGVEAAGSPHAAGTSPSAIACGRDGRVFVANHGSDDVTILESDGSLVGSFPAGTDPVAIALDFSGRIWVSNDLQTTVTRLEPDGSGPVAFTAGPGPRGISVAGDGTLWVSIHTAGAGSTAARLAPDGTFLESVAVGLAPVNHGDGSGFAHASAVDPGGDADLDGWTNAEEIDALQNPFDRTRHPVEITAVIPPSGSVNGGNVIRIEGRGLEAPAAIEIAGVPAAAIGAAASAVEVIAPPGSFPPGGAVDVAVSGPEGSAFTLAGGYTYLNDAPSADPDPDEPDDGYVVPLADPLDLDGTGSSDPNEPLGDSVATFEWSVNGNLVLGATPTISPAALAGYGMGVPGVYPLSLTVKDTLGAPGTAATTVTVLASTTDDILRGDANRDSRVNIADPIYGVQWLFLSGPEPPCAEAADAQRDGRIDIADAIYTINFLFIGGPPPLPPYPVCASTLVVLGCDAPGCP